MRQAGAEVGVARRQAVGAHAQPSLPGINAAPPRTDRLFFALLPDTATAERIARLAQRLREAHGLKGRPIARQRLHVTLHYLGDHAGLPAGLVNAATTAARTMALPPFEVVFDRAASFCHKPRNRPFVLLGGEGVAAVQAFAQALGAALAHVGLGGLTPAGSTPHVTLLYDDRCVAEQPVEPIAWTAHEFVLMHSLIGRSVHVPLARCRLRG